MFGFFRKHVQDRPNNTRPKNRPQAEKSTPRRALSMQQLEERCVFNAYSVINTNDHGAGSLRQAMLDANVHAGADTITFSTTGTIQLISALPTLTDRVDIRGNSAPSYAGTPKVEIDFNHFAGLQFNASAAGSALRGLSLVNASGAGVAVTGGGSMQMVGNYIGLALDGTTVMANGASGIQLTGSTGNTIGGPASTDRNVISGNHGNGITISGGSSNVVENNYIGSDAGGTLDRSNTANGILITSASANNLIGGVATGGNSPTQGTFVRPPLGNLISGNDANGVLINLGATGNQLSGNFIGTTISGSAALGNTLDGVAINGANNNALIGCTFTDSPFVFYNVVSGNGTNGLQVTNSNDTTIQANFFGMGADNSTPVGNVQNGVVVEGTSTRTIMGGPIPLGNVDAANGQNGIVVRDTASFFTTYNTFCGLAAFSDNPTLGNGADGMLITTTGGNILIRTNVVTRNGANGIEIGGAATDVRVAGNIVGMNTYGLLPMGNLGNGVLVTGSAHDLVIGGAQPTFNVVPQNVISANGGNGVAVTGTAHNITISNGYIGTDVSGRRTFGNTGDGVYLGTGTYGNTVGATDPTLLTVISGNQGNGVEMQGTSGNRVIRSYIGTDPTATQAEGNGQSGIYIANSSDNTIGRAAPSLLSRAAFLSNSVTAANIIAYNTHDGVTVASGARNGILDNSIHDNALLGINLELGANANQAAPVLSTIVAQPQSTLVTGALHSTPNTNFTIQLFANSTNAASGTVFLGSIVVRTNASGIGTFSYIGPVLPSGSPYITATATDPYNNTSPFSAAIS